MVNYVVVFLFSLFVSWLVVDAVRIYNRRRLARKTPPAPQEKPHSHSWRKITPFAKQCKECKTIEVAPTAPEGLEEYLKLMASAKDRNETMLHAEEYKFHDQRNQGWTCPKCKYVIPNLRDLPRSPFTLMDPECPYCAVKLLPPLGKERAGVIAREIMKP